MSTLELRFLFLFTMITILPIFGLELLYFYLSDLFLNQETLKDYILISQSALFFSNIWGINKVFKNVSKEESNTSLNIYLNIFNLIIYNFIYILLNHAFKVIVESNINENSNIFASSLELNIFCFVIFVFTIIHFIRKLKLHDRNKKS